MNRKAVDKIKRAAKTFSQMSRARKIRFIELGVVFLTHLFLIAFTPQFGAIFKGFRLSDFQVGKPAPRDLHADKDITYIDEEGTELRREAVAELVSPVFVINTDLTERSLQRFSEFSTLFAEARTKSSSAEKIYLELQASQPGVFTIGQIETILQVGNVLPNLNESRMVLDSILEKGVVSSLDEKINAAADTIEIMRDIDGEETRKIIAIETIVEIERLEEAVEEELSAGMVEEKNRRACEILGNR